jgi:hypothetical protein
MMQACKIFQDILVLVTLWVSTMSSWMVEEWNDWI